MPALDDLYLVWPAEQDLPSPACRIVSAADPEGALNRYIEKVIAVDEEWLALIYDSSPVAWLAARFFTRAGIPLLDEQGEWICEPDEAQAIFAQNVRAFFGPHPEWADLYVRFYVENREPAWRDAMARWQFPPAMIAYILRQQAVSQCEVAVMALREVEAIS